MNENYISGFFDADGSITLCNQTKNSKYKSIKIDFTNVYLEILLEIQEFLLKKYDLKSYISSKEPKSINHNKSYSLTFSNDYAYKLCKIINSFHPKKKFRINTILKYYKSVTKRNGKYSNNNIKRKLAFERLFYLPSFS